VRYGSGGGGKGLLDLLRREDRSARGERNLGPFGGQQQCDGIHVAEPEPAGGEFVDAAHRAEHGGDRCLALIPLPHVAHQGSEIIGGDAVEPSVSVARTNVLVDGASVAGLRGGAQVHHRPSQPEIGRLAEPEPRVRRHRLASSPASKQIVPELASGHDPAVDCAPPLDACCVLESDLKHAGRSTIDVSLHPDAAGVVAPGGHEKALSAAAARMGRAERRHSSSSSRGK
jgi:hypothetical protein